MHVYHPGERLAMLVPTCSERFHISREVIATHEVARYCEIIRSMSASLLVVSSNPGVSTNAILRPSTSNGCATSIVSVQDSRPRPTRRSDPLTRLIN